MTLPLIALGLLSCLLMLMLVLNSGLGTLGRSQLQVVADNASRAALLAIGRASREQPNASISELRDIASAAAREVASGNTVIQGGIDEGSSDLEVELGRFNLMTRRFQALTLMQLPTAVRVTARRSNDAGSGPFRSLVGSSARPEVSQVQSDAVAISSLRCKNLVFVVDLSGSFRASVGLVQNALLDAGELLESPDTVGLVAFAGGVIERTRDDLPVSSVELETPENGEFRQSVERLSDPGVGGGGTNIAAGLRRAEDLIRNGDPNPNCENLVVVLSDGRDGAGAVLRAGAELSEVSSIATVPIGTNGGGERLLREIVSGFGQAFPSNFEEEDLASKTVRAVSTVPPILVR